MSRDFAGLVQFLAERATAPFEWGSEANDCASFVDGAAYAQTGRRALSGARWKTLRGAIKAAEAEGGLEAALDRRFARTAPSEAMRGDIAAVPAEEGPLPIRLMIVEGETLVGPGDRGLKRMPRSAMTAAWSITEGPAE